MRRRLTTFLASTLVPLSVMGAQVTPVYDLRFFGGQHFFEGDPSAVSGNIYFMAAPAVKFNERWSLVPTYAGSYEGTRNVQELAGGGTLFQDSTNHNVSAKGIYSLSSEWKLKATAGARYELLRETKNEDWGDGLFDYRKYSGGLETEYSPSRALGGRVSYDYYLLDFVNYQSLESSQDPTLSRELVGTDVLNSNNHLFLLNGWAPLPGKMRGEFTGYYNLRNFSDQPVVAPSGSLSSADREDKVMNAAVNLSAPLLRSKNFKVLGDVEFGYGSTDSNQNHYDARKTAFQQNYYDWSQMSVAPRLTAVLGEKPWIVTAGLSYQRRNYSDRPIQDADGNYLTEKLNITNMSAMLGLTYPLAHNFKARIASSLGWSDSNMKYEKVFKYNYKIANYMVGFSYEY